MAHNNMSGNKDFIHKSKGPTVIRPPARSTRRVGPHRTCQPQCLEGKSGPATAKAILLAMLFSS